MANWEESNNHYLTAALAWLRLRLRLFAQVNEPKGSPPGKVNSSDCFFHRENTPESPSRKHVTEADVERAARTLAEAAASEPRPALWRLSESLGLSFFEQETLLLCVAMELDMGTAGLCAYAQNSPNNPYPTFALALTLFDHLTQEEEKLLSKAFFLPDPTSSTSPAWEALSANGALRYWRLLEINQVGAQPLTTSPLRADEWVVNYIKGLTHLLDDRLEPLSVPFEVPVDPKLLPASQQQVVQAILNYLERTEHNGHAPVVQLVGADPVSKQLIAGQVAFALRQFLVRLPVELLPAQLNDLEIVARLWQRESMLLPFVLYLDAHEINDLSAASDGPVSVLHRFLAKNPGLVLLDTREVLPGLGLSSIPVDVEKPTPAEQQSAWDEALGSGCEQITSQLAGQFNLNTPTNAHIAKLAMVEGTADPGSLQDVVWQACLQSTRPRLDKLAQRLEVKADWDAIILSVETRKLLEQVTDQVRQRSKVYDEWGFRSRMNRGLGISALFAGESGTGKTMAAEVIANELDLDLYRIDLSAVVSKYIGETEKNLRRVFDAAEDGGAILFFDEADALFGTRTEVKDSHDRYANIEINYLLQRMEDYCGLAILATNMRSALDPAFQRRLRFIVNFPFPGPLERDPDLEKGLPPGRQFRTMHIIHSSRSPGL